MNNGLGRFFLRNRGGGGPAVISTGHTVVTVTITIRLSAGGATVARITALDRGEGNTTADKCVRRQHGAGPRVRDRKIKTAGGHVAT